MLRSLSLAALLLIAGCGTVRANRQPLSPATRASLRSPRTIVALSQTVIGTSIVECNHDSPSAPYAGGGAIGLLATAVVNTAIASGIEIAARSCETTRAQEAEQAAWPVRDALLGHDSGVVLQDALARALRPLIWPETSAVELAHVQARATSKGLLQSFNAVSTQRPVLLARVDQWLTPGFDELVVGAEVWLLTGQTREVMSKSGRTRLEPVPAYHNVLVAYMRLESQPERSKAAQESLIKRWSQEGAARRALDTALEEVAQLVAYDLAPVGPASGADYQAPRNAARSAVNALTSWDDRGFIVYPFSSTQELQKVAGFVEGETPVRKWVRLPTGELVSIDAMAAVAPRPL